MRKTSVLLWATIASATFGCATMRPSKESHPGATEINPKAVTRVYHASATRVAWAMTQVMSKDSILDDVKLMVDPKSNESRPFTREEKEKLGIPSTKLAAKDVNYNIRAKSKDGHRVGVVIQLKDEEDAEVTLLYGVAGDTDLSRLLLDEVSTTLEGPLKKPMLWKSSEADAAPKQTKASAE